MKIYTKTGDDGTTGLFNGKRVYKYSARVECYGTIDELNSIIGIVISLSPPAALVPVLKKISNTLFVLGSDFATPLDSAQQIERISESNIIFLEELIDEYTEHLPKLQKFILPGGTLPASFLHQARTVCRRAERLAVKVSSEEHINSNALVYLNRLSDFLFTAARFANFLENKEEIFWEK
ncbi:MAG TPA: cob(I)yrinic acid a,c-diamide adenosyltransferase [Candidatus Kapabacteria bacterium]|nr:cob(I)yrinic acid a,c-diamide adenosyltransferase [Candidatus Kapabacteria bacterium]HPO64017.1 cob(I)yrinic acid a,c-diamide adenosyltransferase [Candidatus Kapabacteria bacterium]